MSFLDKIKVVCKAIPYGHVQEELEDLYYGAVFTVENVNKYFDQLKTLPDFELKRAVLLFCFLRAYPEAYDSIWETIFIVEPRLVCRETLLLAEKVNNMEAIRVLEKSGHTTFS